MTISAWFVVLVVIPVLLLGEIILRRVSWLARFDIPAPVTGEFLIDFLNAVNITVFLDFLK